MESLGGTRAVGVTAKPAVSLAAAAGRRRATIEIAQRFEKEGFAVVAAGDGEEALALHRRHDPDLVILDLMLPRIDGLEVCRQIRRAGDTPVLMLTARSDDIDAIVGLELGAD